MQFPFTLLHADTMWMYSCPLCDVPWKQERKSGPSGMAPEG